MSCALIHRLFGGAAMIQSIILPAKHAEYLEYLRMGLGIVSCI